MQSSQPLLSCRTLEFWGPGALRAPSPAGTAELQQTLAVCMVKNNERGSRCPRQNNSTFSLEKNTRKQLQCSLFFCQICHQLYFHIINERRTKELAWNPKCTKSTISDRKNKLQKYTLSYRLDYEHSSDHCLPLSPLKKKKKVTEHLPHRD